MIMAGSATTDFGIAPDDKDTRPLGEAERVQRELQALVAQFAGMDSRHPHHVHVLFAELYLCDTTSWLVHLKQTPRPEPAYRVIARFHELYREHVLDRLDRPLHEIAPHWRAYHRLARRLTIRSPISAHLLLLSLGARAHVRFDLGRAIREAGVGDDMDALFGQVSDVAFVQATCAFVELHRARQAGWRRLVLVLYGRGLVLLKPVWLNELQRWRRASYREAREASPIPTARVGSGLWRSSRLRPASRVSQDAASASRSMKLVAVSMPSAERTIVSEDPGARLRGDAERVQRELVALVARFEASGPEHPHHVHVLFAELYLCETASWLAHLKKTPRPEPAYRVIARFHTLYCEHVLDRLDRPLHEIAPHWRAYHRLARRLTIRSPISAHLLLLSLGARAHTRFDLGLAIHDVGASEDMDALFGRVSDAAFVQATRDFVERHRARQAGWRRLVLVLYAGGLVLLKPAWLNEFQRWRRASYRDAREVSTASTAGGGSADHIPSLPQRA